MRRKPYTEIGIERTKCTRCGKPAKYQWRICADGNQWRPICQKCDIQLNQMVLTFMFPKDRTGNQEKIEKYATRLEQT